MLLKARYSKEEKEKRAKQNSKAPEIVEVFCYVCKNTTGPTGHEDFSVQVSFNIEVFFILKLEIESYIKKWVLDKSTGHYWIHPDELPTLREIMGGWRFEIIIAGNTEV